jgi:hypothetical protein
MSREIISTLNIFPWKRSRIGGCSDFVIAGSFFEAFFSFKIFRLGKDLERDLVEVGESFVLLDREVIVDVISVLVCDKTAVVIVMLSLDLLDPKLVCPSQFHSV